MLDHHLLKSTTHTYRNHCAQFPQVDVDLYILEGFDALVQGTCVAAQQGLH